MCKRSPTQVGNIRTIAGIPSSWRCPMTFCRGWPWTAETLCPSVIYIPQPAGSNSKSCTVRGSRVISGSESSWVGTLLILETGAGPALGTHAEDVGVKKCHVGKMQGTFGAGDRGRRQKCTARGSSSAGPMGRRVSVVSMIRPKVECVRRDPWFAVRKVSVLMAGGMPKAERPD